MHRVLVFGAGGRVGLQICAQLMCRGMAVVMVDLLEGAALAQRARRLAIDAGLSRTATPGEVSVHGGVDVRDPDALRRVLEAARPDLVINYAIPITWDATKQLPNYARVSAAGLGAFTPIQLLSPLLVGRAMADLGLDVPFMVGNLPDITVPILAAIARGGGLESPVCGAGNVGLIAAGVRHLAATELGRPPAEIQVHLVAHHIHWVAPREPGYRNDAPFLLRVAVAGEDVTAVLGDGRTLMNRAITDCYEPGAAFSTTTGLLACQVAAALLEGEGPPRPMHVPAPLGLPGGYPVTVSGGGIALALPEDWSVDAAVAAMEQAQQRDGVAGIGEDGTVRFTEEARNILLEELDIRLPGAMPPDDILPVATEQIARLRARFP